MELHFASIFFRWLHMISACLLVGSVYFYQVLLPSGAQESADLRCRRGFKMTVHVTLLFFLVSGIYNALKNWHIYTQNPGVMHGLFGMHLLLGLGAITLMMIALAGRAPGKSRTGSTKWALVLLIIAVGVASMLKSAREFATAHPELAKHADVKGQR